MSLQGAASRWRAAIETAHGLLTSIRLPANIPPSREDEPIVAPVANAFGHDPYAALSFALLQFFQRRQSALHSRPADAGGGGGMGNLRAHAFCHRARPRRACHCVPVVGFSLPAGHLADRFSRPRHHSSHANTAARLRHSRSRLFRGKHLAIPPVWPDSRNSTNSLSAIASVSSKSTIRPIDSTIRRCR